MFSTEGIIGSESLNFLKIYKIKKRKEKKEKKEIGMEKDWYCCRKEAPAFHIIFMHILMSARLCLEYLVHWPTLAHV